MTALQLLPELQQSLALRMALDFCRYSFGPFRSVHDLRAYQAHQNQARVNPADPSRVRFCPTKLSMLIKH